MKYFEPLKTDAEYSLKTIDNAFKDMGDLEKYVSTLQQDSANPDAIEKSGKFLRGDERYYFQANRSPRGDLEMNLSDQEKGLAGFARTNQTKLKSELQKEDYLELVQKLPIYKTGDKEHDDFADVLNDYKKLSEISQDENKKFQYIAEQVNNAPEWVQESFARHGKREYQIDFDLEIQNSRRQITSKLSDSEGTPKYTFVKKVIEDSLNEAEKELNNENYSDSEIKDVYETNIRPYELAILETAYKRMKTKDQNKIDSPKKQERNKRRKQRKEKNMNF